MQEWTCDPAGEISAVRGRREPTMSTGPSGNKRISHLGQEANGTVHWHLRWDDGYFKPLVPTAITQLLIMFYVSIEMFNFFNTCILCFWEEHLKGQSCPNYASNWIDSMDYYVSLYG